jgi:hypothetical protein
MVLNNGEWAEIQHDSTVWLKCVPPCVPLLRSIRPVAHLRLTPWELTRQWKWGTGHDWQHQQNVYFWIAQPPAPWELLSSSILHLFFSTIFHMNFPQLRACPVLRKTWRNTCRSRGPWRGHAPGSRRGDQPADRPRGLALGWVETNG